MNSSVVFALGTLAGWTGWALLLWVVWRVASRARMAARSGPAIDLATIVAGFAGAAGVLSAGALAPPAPGAGTLSIPLLWPVLPVWGWACALACVGAAVRFSQLAAAATAAEKRARGTAAAIWLLVAAVSGWQWSAGGEGAGLMRGSISLLPSQAAILAILSVLAVAVMALAQRSHQANRVLKGAAVHGALIAGSIVFGLPFFWLLITSFKEDRDMSSPTGLVWVPRLSKTVPYDDPDDPVIEAQFQGQTVHGNIVAKKPDGTVVLDVFRPGALRGITVEATPPLKRVPKDVPVVTARLEGQEVVAMAIKEFDTGGRRLSVLEPEKWKGREFEVAADGYEPVRNIGLRVQNYADALDYLPPETARGLVYLKNTLLLVVLSVIGTILSSSLVGYAFARMQFPLKDVLFTILLSTLMLPAAVTMLPTFLIFRTLGWVDSLAPIWAPSFLGSAFNIFLLRQFFAGIPGELEDAAKIDGSGYLRTYWSVMLPQIRPALAFVAVSTVLASWNNFMGPLVYVTSPENMPISYAIQLFQSDRNTEPALLMAFATMGMLPVLLLFLFAQKYFIEGVSLSGLGGR